MTGYDEDFYNWTREQAAALRKAGQDRVNAPVDWENIAEEIESMGRSDRHQIMNRLATLLEHLLKLAHSPAQDPRRGWRRTVREQRHRIDRLLKESPSLRRDMPDFLAEAWPEARDNAIDILDEQDGIDVTGLPEACPWSVEQVMDRGFWPDEDQP
jgi:hypothetical protein